MHGQQKIETLYAFIVTDEDGTEGVPALNTPVGILPAMGADPARIESIRPVIESWMKEHPELPVRLCHFTNRVEVEVLQ